MHTVRAPRTAQATHQRSLSTVAMRRNQTMSLAEDHLQVHTINDIDDLILPPTHAVRRGKSSSSKARMSWRNSGESNLQQNRSFSMQLPAGEQTQKKKARSAPNVLQRSAAPAMAHRRSSSEGVDKGDQQSNWNAASCGLEVKAQSYFRGKRPTRGHRRSTSHASPLCAKKTSKRSRNAGCFDVKRGQSDGSLNVSQWLKSRHGASAATQSAQLNLAGSPIKLSAMPNKKPCATRPVQPSRPQRATRERTTEQHCPETVSDIQNDVRCAIAKLKSAGVPFVDSSSCRVGGSDCALRQPNARNSLHVGFLCDANLALDDGNTEMPHAKVVIKSQNISSAGDHRSVLHDFCTEAIVGWTASPFSATMSPKHLAQHCRALEAVSEQFDSLSLTSDSSLVGSTEATCNHVATDIKRLVRKAAEWNNGFSRRAQTSRVNATYAVVVEQIPSEDDTINFLLCIVTQYCEPAIPVALKDETPRLSMDLADWIQSDAFWPCIREAGGVDTGERAVSKVVVTDSEGNLFNYSMETKMKNFICFEMAKAMLELHRSGVVHCDIKPSNFIVCVDPFCTPKSLRKYGLKRLARNSKSIKLKLIDFAEGGRPDEIQGIIAGTLQFMAPEMTKHGRPSIKSDVYSCGVSMLEVWFGEVWDKKRSVQESIAAALKSVSSRSSVTGQFLQRCLAATPQARPTPKEMVSFFRRQCQSACKVAALSKRSTRPSRSKKNTSQRHRVAKNLTNSPPRDRE